MQKVSKKLLLALAVGYWSIVRSRHNISLQFDTAASGLYPAGLT